MSAVESDLSTAVSDEAHQRAQQRGFAHAVAAEQSHLLAARDPKADAMQHLARAVKCFELLHLK